MGPCRSGCSSDLADDDAAVRLCRANFNSIAMEPLGAIAGTASSTLGFAQTVGGGLVGALIGQAYDGTVFPLAAGYAHGLGDFAGHGSHRRERPAVRS
jgi:hypothetical protein